MKRFLIPAMMLALFAPIGFTGCAEKSEVTKTEEVKTPDGSTTVEDTTTIEKTGDHKTTE
jgi:hypothetical protein